MILKTLRRPYFAIFLSTLMLFISCNENNLLEDQNVNDNKFNFSFYENNKGNLLALDISKLNSSKTSEISRLEANNIILEEVNKKYETDIDFDEELKQLNRPEEIFDWMIVNTDFNENDIEILTNFSENLISTDLDTAISILEKTLSNQNLDTSKFLKYQSIVTGVKLIEYQNKGFFTIDDDSNVTRKDWGCAWALAKLALASASLVAACNPPALGATVGTGCYLAATGFVAASASVGMACKD